MAIDALKLAAKRHDAARQIAERNGGTVMFLCDDAIELIDSLKESIKMCGRAVGGGPWTAADNARLSQLCKMIGHEP